jgi:hypothetical protein
MYVILHWENLWLILHRFLNKKHVLKRAAFSTHIWVVAIFWSPLIRSNSQSSRKKYTTIYIQTFINELEKNMLKTQDLFDEQKKALARAWQNHFANSVIVFIHSNIYFWSFCLKLVLVCLSFEDLGLWQLVTKAGSNSQKFQSILESVYKRQRLKFDSLGELFASSISKQCSNQISTPLHSLVYFLSTASYYT